MAEQRYLMEKENCLEKLATTKVVRQKNEVRAHYLKVVREISKERRAEAKKELLKRLVQRLELCKTVVSFINFSYEIDLSSVNRWLRKEKNLFLPQWERQKGNRLTLYSASGKDPLPEKYDCILVPGVVFDMQNARIGHGKGCYDRLLSEHPEALCIGVGFKEQLSSKLLPQEEHDQKVKECFLV